MLATIQGVIAVALLLWATLGRFGAPQSLPPPLNAGTSGLLQNMASLIEFTGHQETVMSSATCLETVRDVGRQLHAPRGISATALVAWLQRVGSARGVETIAARSSARSKTWRRVAAGIRRPWCGWRVEIHRWKGEIIDGRVRHPRDH